MINDELLAKFDRIQDLPVSEEMLGAYLEDNLTAIENLQIEQSFITNPDFFTFKNNLTSESIDIKMLDEQLKEFSLLDLPILENLHSEVCPSKTELNHENSIESHGLNKKTKR